MNDRQPNPNAGAAQDARQDPDDTPLARLSQAGVSIWLDDLNRPMLADGDLQALIEQRHVVGVTTNPTIFATALAEGEAYTDQVKQLAAAGADVEEAVLVLTTQDVRDACDILGPVHERTGGVDGRVSIEVDPRLATDTAATVSMARRLWSQIDRPNLLIKIPATQEGLPAISQVLSEGMSVNVTLIFALDRYRAVMDAFLTGMERAQVNGEDLSQIHSVASFFVSRMDTEVDARLVAVGTKEALALRGKAALANARLAYQTFEQQFTTDRWKQLVTAGAHPQRPLWASTGVKSNDYPDTLYVTGLVAAQTVNTMPGKTLEAAADHAHITGDTVTDSYPQARQVLADLERLDVSYTEVTAQLETEGVAKFEESWTQLLTTVEGELTRFQTPTDEEPTRTTDQSKPVV